MTTFYCKSCETTKDTSEFLVNRTAKRGHGLYCKVCFNKQRVRQPDEGRKNVLRNYGLTLSDYDDMFESQQGVCAICSTSQEGSLHVDHCHSTQVVRGLLCGRCNRALGLLDDDVEKFQQSINYLKGKLK